MSNEIFKWMPQMVDIDGGLKYNVAISEFENGAVQRGLISDREANKFTFKYINKLLEPGQRVHLNNEIKAFFKARHGSYDNFFIPSWQLEGQVTDALTAGGSTFKLATNPSYLDFSQTVCESGNYIYLCRKFCRGFEVTSTHEIQRILSWTGSGDDWTVTIDGTFTNNYPAEIYVQKAYKVFFTSPELPHTLKVPHGIEYSLEFIEDLASLYQTTFGV